MIKVVPDTSIIIDQQVSRLIVDEFLEKVYNKGIGIDEKTKMPYLLDSIKLINLEAVKKVEQS